MIWALGPMIADALALAERLAREEQLSVGVVNPRFIKPPLHRHIVATIHALDDLVFGYDFVFVRVPCA